MELTLPDGVESVDCAEDARAALALTERRDQSRE